MEMKNILQNQERMIEELMLNILNIKIENDEVGEVFFRFHYLSLGINIDSIPEPMGTCVEWLWFRYRNPWEINSFLAFARSRVVGRG